MGRWLPWVLLAGGAYVLWANRKALNTKTIAANVQAEMVRNASTAKRGGEAIARAYKRRSAK